MRVLHASVVAKRAEEFGRMVLKPALGELTGLMQEGERHLFRGSHTTPLPPEP